MHGREAWDLLVERYNPEENKDSFIDYFWTFRFTHLPIFKMLQLELPKARVYHTISTGYAGLLGVIARGYDWSSVIAYRTRNLCERAQN